MPLAKTLHIARWTLVASLRCRFFWIWNVSMWFVVISLQQFYFFDFDGDGHVIGELFVSTVGLTAAVNSIGFQILFTMRQRRGGVWSTMLSSSTSPIVILAGSLLALVILQEFLAVLYAASFVGVVKLNDVLDPNSAPMAAAVWPAYAVLCLEIVSLSAAHLALGVLFTETWALILMIGVYVIGHLSETLYRSASEATAVLVDLLFCIVPDLESLGYLGSRDAPVPGGLIVNVAIGSLLYATFAVIVASCFLRRAASTRNA
jgi:hypothetical protein